MSGQATVLVTGATGLVGRRLGPALRKNGLAVRGLTRRPGNPGLDPDIEWIAWDGTQVPEAALREIASVVHLAGEPLFAGPLTRSRRQRVRRSRVDATRALVAAIGALPSSARPDCLVCASAVGYYGDGGEAELDEGAPPATGFLARLCVDWETAAQQAEAHGVRTSSLRIGLVLAHEGGALLRLLLPFRLGLGGRLGSGRQWVPWIQIDDLVALIGAGLRNASCRGALNAVAPNPVRNVELTRALGRALHRPTLLPVPAMLVRLALGDLADELLASRRVVPRRALALGVRFAHPSLEEALAVEIAASASASEAPR